jgi:hypothetical protein
MGMIRLLANLKHPFHVSLASQDWLEKLGRVVSERIRQLGGFDTQDGEGEVTSRYGEDRFMGPNSVCKYDFDVRVKVASRTSLGEPDEYRAVATYDPAQGTFVTKSESRTILRLRAAVSELVERLSAIVLNDGPLKWIEEARCPWCGGPVRISFHPEGRVFSIACKSDSMDFSVTRQTPVPPSWWKERVTRNWIS